MQRSVAKARLGVWVICWLVPLSFAWGYPVRDRMTRGAIIAAALVVGLGVAPLLWRRRWGKALCLVAAAGGAGLLLAPGRPTDLGALRADYVRALVIYRGTPFVWGGETRRGVDCSGLIRRALVDAMVAHGLRTLNPGLLRAGLGLWWHDCSAHDLGDGRHAPTRPVLRTPSLNALDHDRILPGDLAVTASGGHALAYLGDRVWIEADPNIRLGDQVITLRVPTTRSAWFSMPAHIVRWRLLDESPAQ